MIEEQKINDAIDEIGKKESPDMGEFIYHLKKELGMV